MAKRASLWSKDNRWREFVPFKDIDELLRLDLVDRLSPINAREHHFRWRHEGMNVPPQMSETTLSEAIVRANAGVANEFATVRHARRKVRAWPHVFDDLAPGLPRFCPLIRAPAPRRAEQAASTPKK
jgi:hypothetical protein